MACSLTRTGSAAPSRWDICGPRSDDPRKSGTYCRGHDRAPRRPDGKACTKSNLELIRIHAPCRLCVVSALEATSSVRAQIWTMCAGEYPFTASGERNRVRHGHHPQHHDESGQAGAADGLAAWPAVVPPAGTRTELAKAGGFRLDDLSTGYWDAAGYMTAFTIRFCSRSWLRSSRETPSRRHRTSVTRLNS